MLLPRNRSVIIGAIIAVLLLTAALYAWAGITGAATGGTAILADTAKVGGTGAWTTLNGPTYAETVNGDLAVGNSVTLTAPAGFEFNPAAAVTVVLIQGDDRQSAANMNETPVNGNVASLTSLARLTLTATTISFPVLSKSRGNTLNTIKWVGIQVRPLQGTPLATGTIRLTVPAGSLLPSSPNAGTLTVVPGAVARMHTVLPGQGFVSGTGVTGTAATQTVGSEFNVQLVATDRFNNLVTTYSGAKTIAYAGPAANCVSAPAYTTSVNFTSGSSTVLATKLYMAETTTITASEGSTVTGPPSSALIVAPAAMSQLVVTLPGQTFSPCVGNIGTPADQDAGVPFTITSITATDSFFNVISSYAGAKTLTYSGPAGPATYTTAVSFSAGTSTTALTTTITSAQDNTFIRASDGTSAGPDSTKFKVKPTVSNFNAFDIATPAVDLSGVIKTKISGVAFALDLVALTSTPAISKGFTGMVKVEIIDNTSGACTTSPSVLSLPDQTFTVGDNGRHRVTGIIDAKAWKNVRVRISHPVASPTIVSCSIDSFSIRPDRFDAARASDDTEATPGLPRTLNNTGLPGSLVHKSGRPFTIGATAASPTGAAVTNYVGTVTAVMSVCSQSGCAPAGNAGVLLINTWTFNNGALFTNNATYSDVGAFSLVLQDRTFAAVDALDSSEDERFISSSPFNVGRFVPDHFTAEADAIVPRTDMVGCATSLFTYMDEPLTVSYKLVARSGALGNAQIKGYQGKFATLNPATPSHLNIGGIDSATSTALVKPISAITRATVATVTTSTAHGLQTGATVFLAGIAGMVGISDKQYKVTVLDPLNFTINADTVSAGDYTGGGYASRISVLPGTGSWVEGAVTIVSPIMLQRLAAPDGPFNTLSIGIAPRDPDGVSLLTFNLDADASGSNERFSVGTTRFLFGRLKLGNAYGKAQLNMRIPIQTQFWTGTGFRQNAEDNCTAITSSVNVPLTDYLGGLSAAKFTTPGSVSIGAAFNAGVGSLVLKPNPAPDVKGSVQISVNLDAEAKKYLKGRGAGSLYDKDPVSRATFGLFKSGPVIYVRETY